jgi:Cu/Zn superoxide dismutase
VRRITKAALGGLAGCALVLGGTQVASGETLFQQVFPGWLTDLDPDGEVPPNVTTGAFDSAKAKLKVTKTSDGMTTFSLEVRDIDPSFDGRTFGSHLHTGSCKPGDPTAAGGHYTNKDLDPLLPLEEREVWFTVVPNEGVAADQTVVDYVPKDLDGDGGIMSIVIHRDPTNTDPLLGVVGGAGPREVCLPLVATWD